MTLPENPKWRKSSYSGNNPGQCVEVAALERDVIGVRDSKDPDGGRLTSTARGWHAFLASVKAGAFDR